MLRTCDKRHRAKMPTARTALGVQIPFGTTESPPVSRYGSTYPGSTASPLGHIARVPNHLDVLGIDGTAQVLDLWRVEQPAHSYELRPKRPTGRSTYRLTMCGQTVQEDVIFKAS